MDPRAIFCNEIKEWIRLCMVFWRGQACCSSWAVSEWAWQNSGLAEKAQLGVNVERQWHRVKNSTWFCWTCHSLVHSCEESLGTIWMLFVLFWPIFGTAFTKPLWEGWNNGEALSEEGQASTPAKQSWTCFTERVCLQKADIMAWLLVDLNYPEKKSK